MAAEQQGTDSRQSQPVTAACRAGLLLLRTAARQQQQGLARAARATTVPRSAAAPSSARHAVVPGTAALHRPAGCTGHCGRCAACPQNEGGAQQRLPPLRRVQPLSLFRATRGRPPTTMRAHACPPAPPLHARALSRQLRSSHGGGAGGAAAADVPNTACA
eukprot:COSAG01_NODE_510_length_16076_cov_102.088252_19_plen_161_part_00